ATEIGVRGEHVLTAAIRLPDKEYTTLADGEKFYGPLVEKLKTSPGIQGAAVTCKLPLQGGRNGYIKIPGQQDDSVSGPLVEWSSISPEYFHVMGIPLLDGRELSPDDFEMTAKMMRAAHS